MKTSELHKRQERNGNGNKR